MAKEEFEIKLDRMISQIKHDTVRQIMDVCKGRKCYPRDCITDGALQKLVEYILELESRYESKA